MLYNWSKQDHPSVARSGMVRRFFCDGLVEDRTTELPGIKPLLVISPRFVLPLKKHRAGHLVAMGQLSLAGTRSKQTERPC